MIGLNELGNAPLANTGDGVDLTSTSDVIVGRVLATSSPATGETASTWAAVPPLRRSRPTPSPSSRAPLKGGQRRQRHQHHRQGLRHHHRRHAAGAANIISGNTLNGVNIDSSTRTPLINTTTSGSTAPRPPPWATATTACMCSARASDLG